MFSGIIEAIGEVTAVEKDQNNLNITIHAPFTQELKVDQSIAHNGVCLTVVEIIHDHYVVTAIGETLQKSNLGSLKSGDPVNLERCLRVGDRLDGHIVQGHVDQTALCTNIFDTGGSWMFSFEYDPLQGNITVEKGSICVNGVSLTVVDSKENSFSVCLIPYTYENTNFRYLQKGDPVNLEFDILGKYISKLVRK
jgi:riboflavin synthase